jgi:ADP-dependent NAD(P)H-hydrate dehydratase / NAD(P)H-hydrate epimerase
MIPIVTPAEMAAIDAAAPEPVEVLIGRAGAAVARVAIEMLGGTYGRRVVVLAGKGNNGNDGRDAARRLRRRGMRVMEVDAAAAPSVLPSADLIVDAAYGTGFRGSWRAPEADAPVLAVDIPSGVDGLTGAASERVLSAARTVTFAALKPGLLLAAGSELAGEIEVVDIGLDVSGATAWLMTDEAVAALLPPRQRETHKWKAAVWIAAGSPGMTGAAHLSARGAQRAGAGYVRLGTPGGGHDTEAPEEVVGHPLPSDGWANDLLQDLGRFRALVVGPGLGRAGSTLEEVARVIESAQLPLVLDGDGLHEVPQSLALARERAWPLVLTPHDGEFEAITGAPPGPDRFEAARSLAADLRCVVLLKGSTTIVADETGRVLVANQGDPRLATAGTGDVLSGIIGAFLARGVPPLEAAATAAFVHGRAGTLGWPSGLVAGDLPDLVPAVLDSLHAPRSLDAHRRP